MRTCNGWRMSSCAARRRLTRELGMPIGLYGDYAVGANPSGSETWADQSSYRMGAEIGAPPDPLALKGQGWGIPPQDPLEMQAQRLQGFVRLIRNNMRYYGALRLDHVMSLFRLWWVAAGFSPTEAPMCTIPCSSCSRCWRWKARAAPAWSSARILGVVPDEMRQAMPEYGLYHYKVLLFEKLEGRFRRPEEYRAARAGHGHHARHADLAQLLGGARYRAAPPLESVSQRRNRERCGPRAGARPGIAVGGAAEQGLKPAQPATPQDAFTAELAHALHLYLARSATALVALQIEDLLGMTEPVNVPGTDQEYPNWQRKVSADIEDMAAPRIWRRTR